MDFKLLPLDKTHLAQFKTDMREAFQKGAETELGTVGGEILPESPIDHSLNAEGAVAYEAIVDGKTAGGAIVVIDNEIRHNHLDFLYVKAGVQSKGIGRKIWNAIEKLHPDTKIWETCTPYFEKRNIHFYINCCGFHAVEFFNKYHADPNDPDERDKLSKNDCFNGMFRFEKTMSNK